MKNFFKKGITFALAFTLVVTMCFGSVGTAKAYADGANYDLTIYDGDKFVKGYTLDDLWDIAKEEGSKNYKYSGYNRNPSFYVWGDPDNTDTPPKRDVQKCVGPTVEGVLKDAGVTFTDNQLITFEGSDGVPESFVAGELFKERYYFPNGKIEVPYKGTPATEEDYTNAEPVVPIIDLHRRTDNLETPDKNEDEHESVLRFGQTAPNEQNYAVFVKYIADGGKIIVGEEQDEAWESITATNLKSGVVLPETEIKPVIPDSLIGQETETIKYTKKISVYYTMDGSKPGYGDAIFNYSKDLNCLEYMADDYNGKHINTPILEKEGTYTIKFKVIGYGKLDSEVTTFTYEVKDVAGPAVPAEFTVAAQDSSMALLAWEPVQEASYYEVLKYDAASDKHIVYAQTKETTFADTAVKPGESVSYQVRAIIQLSSGQLVYGTAAAKQAIIIPAEPEQPTEPDEPADEPAEKPEPPTVAKTVLKSVAKTGYSSIQVKWGKVADADGYEVWRYDKVSKKYKRVKTITNKNTVSWKNTGLKTGRKYTYKVRAYVDFEGEKVYGKYSAVRAATPALSKPVITKLTPGKKSVTVKWKKVAGANGYKIYRATSKNGKYTCVKTIKKGGTLSWKNTKLKKGKRYYYKVKAYRTVDKKNVFSSNSSVKYIKSK